MIVRPEAAHDAAEASHWYEQRVAGLGMRFLGELNVAMASIDDSPKRYPVYRGHIRRARVKKFPFGIFYIVAEKNVVVLAVFNLPRDQRLLHRMLKRR